MDEIEIIIEKEGNEELEINLEHEDVIIKYNFDLQEKTLTPTKESQIIIPDKNYDGISRLVVNPIPDEYVIPKLGIKNIVLNGTYDANDDQLDGYTEISVDTTGEIFNTNPIKSEYEYEWVSKNYLKKYPEIIIPDDITSLQNFCYQCNFKIIPKIICNNNVKDFLGLYYGCRNATTIDVSGLNTENMIGMNYFVYNCQNLINLDLSNIDAGKISGTANQSTQNNAFSGCTKLENLKFMKNLGKGYYKSLPENYSYAKVNLYSCTNLTEASLIDVLKKLYNIASLGITCQTCELGTSNIEKLTSEEGQAALAQAKEYGWNVK